MKFPKAKYKRGQAIIIAVIGFLGVSLAITLGSISPFASEVAFVRTLIQEREALYRAEAGVEDVIYRVKKGYTITANENVPINGKMSAVAITSGGGTKTIIGKGENNDSTRFVSAEIFQGQGTDFFYGIQVGDGGLTMESSSKVYGTVYSNAGVTGISSSQVVGDVYAVGAISSPAPSVSGTKYTGVAIIEPPGIDQAYWKVQANINNNPYIGDLVYHGGTNILGPKKIQGNLEIGGGSITITGPIHVTGNLLMNSSSDIYLSDSFGSTGTVIIVDGTITFDSSSRVFSTSSNPKGYLMFFSTKTGPAIEVNSSASSSAIVYAPNGTIAINSSAQLISIVAKHVELRSSASIVYDQGLANANFTSGPSGGWQIGTWKEVAQ